MGDRPVLTVEETRLLLTEYLPGLDGFDVVEVAPDGLVLTAGASSLPVRPGGTVSGPALFMFADVASYIALSAYRGRTPSAMLTSSSISFLEAAEPGELRARVEAVRIGRRTAVFTARVEDGPGRAVALATLHFSFPGGRRRDP
ncbi:PaaI family thioesterase [Streptomyces sp. NPDC014734]|uniref:PaaI family thioesterase n=1 Tax=Streptomyces sp. NPDC014734 TaxID=3364886 RepID=UPI0036FAA625